MPSARWPICTIFISFLVLGNYLTSTYISPDYNSPLIYWWGYCNLSIMIHWLCMCKKEEKEKERKKKRKKKQMSRWMYFYPLYRYSDWGRWTRPCRPSGTREHASSSGWLAKTFPHNIQPEIWCEATRRKQCNQQWIVSTWLSLGSWHVKTFKCFFNLIQ